MQEIRKVSYLMKWGPQLRCRTCLLCALSALVDLQVLLAVIAQSLGTAMSNARKRTGFHIRRYVNFIKRGCLVGHWDNQVLVLGKITDQVLIQGYHSLDLFDI